jgi:BirA family biotin operon repressor/biotin-[acetyl-CoA-carboxylase] ligase
VRYLLGMPNSLSPDAIARCLSTRWLGRADLRVVAETGSTNRDMLDAPDALHGAVLIAEEQTAGRGRRDRTWSGAVGQELLFSVALQPPVAFEHWPSLSLVAGVAVHEAMSRALARAVDLKWPNDILVDGRKICGILCESVFDPSPRAVVGIGLNVNSLAVSRPPELAPIAASLREIAGREFDRAEVLASLLGDLERSYEAWLADRAAVFRDWERRAGLPGRKVRVQEDAASYDGVAQGIDADGCLRVTVNGVLRRVACGDVALLT